MNTGIHKAVYGVGLIVCLLFAMSTYADPTEPDCEALGKISLKTGSGMTFELDGEEGGCNADASRYSFGNVIGSVRIYPGEWALTGSEFVELTLDEPFEFERYRHPFSSLLANRYLGLFETREGLFVYISMTPLRGDRTVRSDRYQIHEFMVLKSPSLTLGDNVIYHEYDRLWSVSRPIADISGVLQERDPRFSANLPISDQEVSLYYCRDRDGLVGTARTDSNGEFRFDGDELGLFDGNYQLRFQQIAGLELLTDRFRVFDNGFTNCADFDSPDNRRNGWQGRDAESPINVLYLPAP